MRSTSPGSRHIRWNGDALSAAAANLGGRILHLRAGARRKRQPRALDGVGMGYRAAYAAPGSRDDGDLSVELHRPEVYLAVTPPSITSSDPVMNEDSSEASSRAP